MFQEVEDLDPSTRPQSKPQPGQPAPASPQAKLLDRVAASPYPRAILLYLGIRSFGVLILAAMSAYRDESLIDRLTAWDGLWYLRLVVHGYAELPGTLDAARQPYPEAPMAFFPLYPRLVDAVTWLGIDLIAAALTVSLLAGFVLACGLIRIGRLVSDGNRTGFLLVALWAGAPMAIVFSMTYTEAVFCALAVWALVGVLERNWLLAGVCTLAAGLSRSTAVVLVGVVVIAALIAAIRRAPERRSALACMFLAPVGFVGYLTFVAIQTGSLTGWQDIELRGWNTEFDFGMETAEVIFVRLASGDTLFSMMTVLLLLAAIVLAVLAAVRRLPWPLTMYGIGVLLLVLGTRGLPDAKMRFLLPAFPLLIPIAIGLAKRERTTAVAVVVGWVLLGAWFSAHSLTVWPYAI